MDPKDEGNVLTTARREFRDESGGAVTISRHLYLVAVIDFYRGGEHLTQCHVFLCKKWYGEICETDEMGAPQVFDIRNMPYDQMMPGDAEWLGLVFSGKRIRGDCYYNADLTALEKPFEYAPL